jgi:hypothetical protein
MLRLIRSRSGLKAIWSLLVIMATLWLTAESVLPALAQSPPRAAKYYFTPNQLAGHSWNQINGHIEGSFSNLSLWSQLRQHLVRNNGGFGITSPEMPFTSDATLNAMREAGLAIMISPPGFTQCEDAQVIADAELGGANNSFAARFGIVGKGYFATKEGTIFRPDEIALDEREPTIVPWAFPGQQTKDHCPSADGFLGGHMDRRARLIEDYVRYAQAVKAKWPDNTPGLSLAWNVNPVFTDQSAFLEELVKTLCEKAACPVTIWTDVDWTGGTDESIVVLKRYKGLLERYRVGFGVLLSGDPFGLSDHRTIVEDAANRDRLVVAQYPPSYPANQLFESSQLNILDWLIRRGVVDANTRLSIVSWTARPRETGSEVSENIDFSLAHTANRLFNEELIKNRFAQ